MPEGQTSWRSARASDPVGRLRDAVGRKPAGADGLDDAGVHRGIPLGGGLGTEAEQVDAREQGEDRGLRDAGGAAGAGHVEGVADDHPLEPEILAKQPQHGGGERRGAVRVEGVDDDVRRHDAGHPGVDRGAEREQLAFPEDVERHGDPGQAVV